ncbi:hypothetical protein BCR32DRAFT_308485 [Anaeromyces robustus]|uniref:AAA-ATPase-like domain-containing protein n=1 Tax=Anaeromyces robustus TaxID=1754192 RepID=A0A1Y1V4M1_9FUNG|nr:hypothetical protein BCR32DRAFT_308485 [Anaeromyces robustus]|eukprot:ORX46950.1 hypothetical protein BCR32DRAFT_308485 [Anaeromyces robustus]
MENEIFNPGLESYKRVINSEVYVDKTELILEISQRIFTTENYICNSRPRRFGKTVTADMLTAYYNCKFNDENDIKEIIQNIKNYTNRYIVLIIDEWDCVLRMRKNLESQKEYIYFLNYFIKDNKYIALAYMTGILPIKKYGENSCLNNFDEYSMVSPGWTAKYVGFTEDEVKLLCERLINNQQPGNTLKEESNKRRKIDENNKKEKENKDDIEESIHKNELNFINIKNWYNGYQLKDSKTYKVYEIYTPLSVLNTFKYGKIDNYWNKSETYGLLKEYINKNYFGLKQDIIKLKEGKEIKININTYQNDMTSFDGKDDILTMLVHLGYLNYNTDTKKVCIPNEEVLEEFENSTKSEDWNFNEEKVAEIIEYFHNEVDNKSYNSEEALRFTIKETCYIACEYYNEYPELDAGKDYVDIAYIPINIKSGYLDLIIELKYNKNVKKVLYQIKRRQYPQKLERYQDNMLLIGINYDKKAKKDSKNFKHHTKINYKLELFIH